MIGKLVTIIGYMENASKSRKQETIEAIVFAEVLLSGDTMYISLYKGEAITFSPTDIISIKEPNYKYHC